MMNAVQISKIRAREIWINAQGLNKTDAFGSGANAVKSAIEQLGYVQIDTINVIERCHHHIFYNRIPQYQRDDLTQAQSHDKTVFEYWTHALSYVPTQDLPYFIGVMKAHREGTIGWHASLPQKELKDVLARIKRDGALAISDIKDDKLVEKTHAWGSKKPSKKALQAAFYNGQVAISGRKGMLKTYELMDRHFGWQKWPKQASDSQVTAYLLNRALRAQGLVSLPSICHLDPKRKPGILALIEKEVRAKRLLPVNVIDCRKTQYWARPETLEQVIEKPRLTHILSPFDPLIILRKRTAELFDYNHIFEAYVPAIKRKFGYFSLPVLFGDEIIAILDLKTDRQAKKLLIQKWHWSGDGNAADHKQSIDEQLNRFEKFQLANIA